MTAPGHATTAPLRRGAGVAVALALTMAALGVFLFAKWQVLPGWDAPLTFDGMYYQSIQQQGYRFDGNIEQKGNTAFLPLMAMLIGAASALPGSNQYLEVVVLGALVLFLTLLGVHRFAAAVAGEAAGRMSAALWAFSPMAFYNFVGYTEPLFAMLTIWTLIAIRHDRAWWAVALAGLSVVGRPAGLVLVLMVAIWLVWQHRQAPRRLLDGPVAVQLSLLFLPIMAFATWAALRYGDSVVYVNSIEAWRRGSVFDGNVAAPEALVYFLRSIAGEPGAITHWSTLLTGVSLTLMAWVLMMARREIMPVVWLYLALLGFMFFSASLDVMNIARRSLYMVPWVVIAAVGWARLRPHHPGAVLGLLLWLVVAIGINIVAVGRYYRGEWVS